VVPDVQPQSARRRLSLDLVVLVAASLALALPFAVLQHVNTIDGPGHVLGARLLGSLGSTALAQHYYLDSITFAPNLLTAFFLSALMTVVSPTWSEKLLAIGYIVGFPLAVRFAIRSVNPSAGWLALLSLPFTVSYLFLYGFYDFCYGMVGAFVAIGLAIRWRGQWNVWRAVVLALVLVLTLAAHIVPWVMAAVIIGVLVLTDAISQYRHDRSGRERPAEVGQGGAVTAGPSSGGVFRRVLVPPALAVVPSVVLTVMFFLSDGVGGGAMQRKSLTSLVEGLATLTLPIVTYTRLEIVAALLTVLVLVVVFVLSVRRVGRAGLSTLCIGLGASVVVSTVIYFASPDTIGTGSLLNDRLSLFPPLMLLLTCAALPAAPGIWRSAGLVGLAAALLAAGVRLPTQVRYDRQVTEYLTVERAIAPGKTLVALRFTVFSPPLGDQRYKQLDPLAHEASRVAADNGDIDLRHFEGQLPYFPYRFRPGLENLAQRYLNDYNVPPAANLSAYNKQSGRAVDYVLLVGLNQASAAVRNAPATRALEQVLARNYVHVMTTRPSGLVELYRYR
jgi:hypothetical protein